MSITSLPFEIKQHVVGYLPICHRKHISLTARDWNKVANTNSVVPLVAREYVARRYLVDFKTSRKLSQVSHAWRETVKRIHLLEIAEYLTRNLATATEDIFCYEFPSNWFHVDLATLYYKELTAELRRRAGIHGKDINRSGGLDQACVYFRDHKRFTRFHLWVEPVYKRMTLRSYPNNLSQ